MLAETSAMAAPTRGHERGERNLALEHGDFGVRAAAKERHERARTGAFDADFPRPVVAVAAHLGAPVAQRRDIGHRQRRSRKRGPGSADGMRAVKLMPSTRRSTAARCFSPEEVGLAAAPVPLRIRSAVICRDETKSGRGVA